MNTLNLELNSTQSHSFPSDDSSSSSGDDDSESRSKSTQPNSSSHNDNGNTDMDRGLSKAFIEREERHVCRVRYILASAILIFAFVVSGSVYMFAHRSEHHSFEHEYDVFATETIASIQWENNYNFALMKQLSSHVTGSARDTAERFPNLTVTHFEIEAGYVNGLSGMIACAYAPIISDNDRDQWEEYASKHIWWINESVELRKIHNGHLDPLQGTRDDENKHETAFQGEHEELKTHTVHELDSKQNVSKSLYNWVNGIATPLQRNASEVYAPIWQVTPPVAIAVNSDLLSSPTFFDLYSEIITTNKTAMSTPAPAGEVFDFLFDEHQKFKKLEPYSYIAEPVFESFAKRKLVGMVIGLSPFDNLLDFLFSEETKGVICVFTDNCGMKLTYELNGPRSTFLGYDDLHDAAYDKFRHSASLKVNQTSFDEKCKIEFHIYPSVKLQSSYETKKPLIYASIVMLSFFLTSIMIILYDFAVTRRQEKTMRSALQNGALIASLFPAIVRDRLLEDTQIPSDKRKVSMEGTNDDNDNIKGYRTRPIADFFPSTTIMFADISGFTAWSSTREPFQVFELLETIYGEFDEIAKRRRIFKVETVGDCYVAVSGIPEARDDHAVAMAKFARDCLIKMRAVTKVLEVKLGPDTSALAFRVGIHSGPVTGGVLRGDNARFQLFGDTVNTAARMESTGLPHRIQVSQTTADLLIEASKEHWVKPREEVVLAKGKGQMKTFWLTIDRDDRSSRRSTASQSSGMTERIDLTENENLNGLDEKTQRLANWNVKVLLSYLTLIVTRRGNTAVIEDWTDIVPPNVAVVDEIAEIITLPTFSTVSNPSNEFDSVSELVKNQLQDYVESIAMMYRNNPFHNFEHASHVTMSVVKLMGRIVPTTSNSEKDQNESKEHALALHDHTYGITSDPLTQFSCIFSALIHDVDHYGVTNTQLVKEQAPIAQMFNGNSVLEQNSVVLAWNLLMEPRFEALRSTLCATRTEAMRFRQLVVNAVMATDIMAPDLKAARNMRWSKAFSKEPLLEAPSDTINRKATIVIDHMIQASDVCHTMQHWHVYRKWNERLFTEMTKAYNEGRSDKDPADTWYQGEIGFFDYYIIPLAKKLADCGVFGVSSDEYLTYAVKNRDEWEARGEEVVREMVERIKNNTANKGK